MPTRLTPHVLASAIDADRDEESTFERLRHVRHENRPHAKRKRRFLERIQQDNAKARRLA